jgi:hypothetical protein
MVNKNQTLVLIAIGGFALWWFLNKDKQTISQNPPDSTATGGLSGGSGSLSGGAISQGTGAIPVLNTGGGVVNPTSPVYSPNQLPQTGLPRATAIGTGDVTSAGVPNTSQIGTTLTGQVTADQANAVAFSPQNAFESALASYVGSASKAYNTPLQITRSATTGAAVVNVAGTTATGQANAASQRFVETILSPVREKFPYGYTPVTGGEAFLSITSSGQPITPAYQATASPKSVLTPATFSDSSSTGSVPRSTGTSLDTSGSSRSSQYASFVSPVSSQISSASQKAVSSGYASGYSSPSTASFSSSPSSSSSSSSSSFASQVSSASQKAISSGYASGVISSPTQLSSAQLAARL